MELEVSGAAEAPPVRRCSNCRISLRAEGVLADDREYCCEGCSTGGPCCC